MIQKTTLILIFSLSFLNLNAQQSDSTKAEDGNSGIIYGGNYAYSLTAPKGWVLDNSSGVDQGLDAVFYEVNSSWNNGITVMYTNFSTTENGENYQSAIDFDKNTFSKDYPGIEINREKDLTIDRGKITAQVYSFKGGGYNNYEAVAYIPAKTGVVLVIITSRDKNDFSSKYSAFENLVQSFFWLTDQIEIQK